MHLRSILFVGAICTGICLPVADASAACAPRSFGFNPGGRTDWEVSVPRETVCTLNYGVRSDITAYRVLKRPAHGTLGAAGQENGRYMTAYKPNAGFVGSDVFAVKFGYTPRDSGIPLSTTLFVRVNVGP